MKRILIVSNCTKRRGSIGLVGGLINTFAALDKTKYNISLLDTNFFESNHMASDYNVDSYITLDRHFWDLYIRKTPKLRAWYSVKVAVNSYKRELRKKKYDVVVVHEVPVYADELVNIAHQYGAKIVFEPFGSDILQVSDRIKRKLKRGFAEVDGVCGRVKSNVLIAAQEVYNVPQKKIKEQREIVSGVVKLKELRGKLSRREMHDAINIPFSEYNIVCGYSGRKTHRHRAIIDALIQVKDLLPKGYQVVFPMTYGAGQHHEIIINYAEELKTISDEAGLNTVFMTDFKTAEQMAYLHLITDLFIEIQPTDNGNAFMIEALFAQNQIITGRWLNYKRFELYGEPYYLIDAPEDLPKKLKEFFTHQLEPSVIPNKLIEMYDVPDNFDKSVFWSDLFDNI